MERSWDCGQQASDCGDSSGLEYEEDHVGLVDGGVGGVERNMDTVESGKKVILKFINL